MAAAASLPGSVIVDCEVTVKPAVRYPGLRGIAKIPADEPLPVVFDILGLDGNDLRPLPLSERHAVLGNLLNKLEPGIIRSSQFFDPHASCNNATMGGRERIVCKDLTRPYVSGKSRYWHKMKCAFWRERDMTARVLREALKDG